ncbi:hypothetical protein [Thermococcus sp.]
MYQMTPRNFSLAIIFTLTVGIALGMTEGNIGMGFRFGLWAFLVFYLIPMAVVGKIKPKSEGIEVGVFYLTMVISGLLLTKPFGVSLGDIQPMLYGAVFGALFGALLHSGGFERLEKFVDEKLQPDIRPKQNGKCLQPKFQSGDVDGKI